MTIHLRCATIAMQGTRPLYDRKNLARLLEVLETNGVAPATFGFDERGGDPYTRDAALALLDEPPNPFEQTDLILRRSGSGKYFAMIALWDDAFVLFRFDAKQRPGMWPRIFAIADSIADLFEPDWGAVGLDIELREPTQKFATDDERDTYLMSEAIDLSPKDYNRHGPHGLAMRTYIGPFFAEQLGRERVETLPLGVEKLAWGGYRVDLVPEPWTADVPPLLAAWRGGMAHLRDANVLAVPSMTPTYAQWSRGTSVKLRGE
jgi:hypothetical protein